MIMRQLGRVVNLTYIIFRRMQININLFTKQAKIKYLKIQRTARTFKTKIRSKFASARYTMNIYAIDFKIKNI